MSNFQEAKYKREFNSSYNYGNDKRRGGDNNLVKFSYKNNSSNAELHAGAYGNRDGFNENRENGRKNYNNGKRYGVIEKRDYRNHDSNGYDGERYHPKDVRDGAMVNRDNGGNRNVNRVYSGKRYNGYHGNNGYCCNGYHGDGEKCYYGNYKDEINFSSKYSNAKDKKNGHRYNGCNNNELHSYTYKKSGNCYRRSPERRNTDEYSYDCEGGSHSYGNNKYRSGFKVHNHSIADKAKKSKVSTKTVSLPADRPKLTQSIGQYKIIRLADGKSTSRWNNPLPNGFQKLSGDSAIATVVDVQPDGPYKVIRIRKMGDKLYEEEKKRITEGASKKIKKPAARYAKHDNFDYHRERLVNQLQNKPKANIFADLDLFAKKQRLIEKRNQAAYDEVLAAGRKLNMLKIDENSSSEDENA